MKLYPSTVKNMFRVFKKKEIPKATERENNLFVGMKLLDQLQESKNWVHRRVESIVPLDGEAIQNSISIDFTAMNSMYSSDQNNLIVPIGIPEKRSFTSFSLKDGEGKVVPSLLSEENGKYAFSLLTYLASLATKRSIPASVEKIIKDIVTFDTEEAIAVLNQFKQSSSKVAKDLNSDLLFEYWSEKLASHFILFAVIESPPNKTLTRKVLKYTHIEKLKDVIPETLKFKKNPIQWLLVKSAFVPIPISSPRKLTSLGRSYHLEMTLPEGLEFGKADLVVHKEDNSIDTVTTPASLSGRRAHINVKETPYDHDAHFIAKARGAPPWLIPSSLSAAISAILSNIANTGLKNCNYSPSEKLGVIAILIATLSVTLPIVLNQIKANPYISNRYLLNKFLSQFSIILPGIILLRLQLGWFERLDLNIIHIFSWLLFSLLVLAPICQRYCNKRIIEITTKVPKRARRLLWWLLVACVIMGTI